MNGEMNLKIETDLVSVTTYFKDLGNPPWGKSGLSVDHIYVSHLRGESLMTLCDPAGDGASQDGGPTQSRDPDSMAEARVDVRKLQQFLVGQQVNPSKSMCSEFICTSSTSVTKVSPKAGGACPSLHPRYRPSECPPPDSAA